MFFFLSLTLSAFVALLSYETLVAENASLKRVNAHLMIGDMGAAAAEAAAALKTEPYNRGLHEGYIRALAKAGNERQMFYAFERYRAQFDCHSSEQRRLYEDMAWGIIAAGERSFSPIIRLSSLIAAFFGEDAKSVQHLSRACYDPNSAVRSAAVQLICHLNDEPLCNEVKRLFREEKVWSVRLEVIKAIGKMKIIQEKDVLVALVGNLYSGAEEKAAAINSLVNLLEDVDRSEIASMASSNRAGLRVLACELIVHLQSHRDADLLLHLAADSCSEVRAAALRSIGRLGLKEIDGKDAAELAKEKCSDSSINVAITAAWLLMIQKQGLEKKDLSVFSFWLEHENSEIRQQAAAALAATGSHGIACMQKNFYNAKDSTVKINLALGLIQQGIDILPACNALYSEFIQGTRRWKWDEEDPFSGLLCLKTSQSDGISGSVEEIHQLTQLKILNLLAILKYPMAQEAIRTFLQQKKWGISGLATAVLLTEGDYSAIGLVENILSEASPAIKIQAALILALWGRGEKALGVLEQGYLSADRETKEKILEGVGRIGSLSSVRFLLERLQDPQQTLRLIAAAALLQCLYH